MDGSPQAKKSLALSAAMGQVYAGLWGSIIMGDIHERILKVIDARCEKAAART